MNCERCGAPAWAADGARRRRLARARLALLVAFFAAGLAAGMLAG